MPDPAFTTIRTARLVLRRLVPEDAPALAHYRSLPEVAATSRGGRSRSPTPRRWSPSRAGSTPGRRARGSRWPSAAPAASSGIAGCTASKTRGSSRSG